MIVFSVLTANVGGFDFVCQNQLSAPPVIQLYGATAVAEVINVAYEKTVACKFKAYLEAINEADTVIVVYDPDDSRCEREAAAAAVAEMLNKQILMFDPKTIRLQ